MKGSYVPAGEALERDPPSNLKLTLLQVLIALGTSLQMLAPGMVLGYSAVALPQLRNETSFPPLDEEQSSWFASVSSVSTPVGCLLAGWIVDTWGRRVALVLLNVPGLAGWALLAAAQGLTPLFAGRLLTGLSGGMATATANVYLGEVTLPRLRGALMCWNSLSIAAGILAVYLLGSALPWRWAAGAAVVPVGISLIAAALMPESVSWLLSRGRLRDAETTIVRMRGGGGAEVRAELETLARAQEARSKGVQESGVRKFTRSLRKPEFWKPLLIMNLFFAFQQFAGLFVVIFYAVDVVTSAGVGIDKYLATVLIGVARLLVTAGVSVAMRHVGRRPLAILSGVGMTICMLGLSGYLFLTRGMEPEPMTWLPTVAILGYIVTSTIGFLTLPWAMLGEVFPSELRGAGGGITTCCAYLMGFAVLKAYPAMQDALGAHGTFLVYGIFALLGTGFVAVWLPETAGRSLAEVEAYFAGTKRRQQRAADQQQERGSKLLEPA